MSIAVEFEIEPLALPLKKDGDGAVRVGGSRVLLQTVVWTFLEGSTCEEIAQKYPTVSLPDIYATITFYLQHQVYVDAYLAAIDAKGEALRREFERRWNPQELRERLLRRKASR